MMTMITTITLIKYLIMTYVLIDLFGSIIFELKLKIKNKYIKLLISKLICWKCTTFWITLILTSNLFFACINVCLIYIIEYIENYIKIKTNI